MNAAERIEAAVGGILPTYHASADLGGAPERYIVYELVERGGEYGEGAAHAADHMVTLNILTPALELPLYEEIKAAMQAAGFSYSGGGDTMTDAVFPYGKHWYQDYGL